MYRVEYPEHWLWKGEPLQPGPAVIFDMDGVLSNAVERQHFITGGNRNWKAFFAAVGDDSVIDEMALLLGMLEPRLQIILLTGRPFSVQAQTRDWLERHALRWDLLIMRVEGDYSRAREFKQKTLKELQQAGFRLHLAFEDDLRNAEMFRGEGVPCVYIHSGYYE